MVTEKSCHLSEDLPPKQIGGTSWASSDKHLSKYSSLPNRCGAHNKHGAGKDEPFLISVVSGMSMVGIFRPPTVIKRRTKWIKVSN